MTFDVICGATARTHWYVATTGSDITGSGTLTSPLLSIQTAINAATDGDTVSVASGTYVENIEINKEIAIIGNDRSTTIIDGDSSGSVVYFGSNAGTGALLKDFTIQNGTGRYGPHAASDALCGGGIFLDDGSSPKLKRLIVTNNRAEGRGAGIFKNTGATLLVRNTIINNNHGTDNSQLNGAGIGGDGGGDGSIIYGCTIENNHATSESGGIHLPDHPVIINTIIANNTSNYRSSAIYAWGASISNCTIMSNGDDGNSNNDPALMKLDGPSLIQNTIIWDSYPGGETIYYDNELRVEYSIIEGLNGNFVANGGYSFQFEGNASNDPLLDLSLIHI